MEEKKEDWVKTSDWGAVLKMSWPGQQRALGGLLDGGVLTGAEMALVSPPCSHWLGAAWEECGLGVDTAVD